jgi:protein O-GlcNAc transferase
MEKSPDEANTRSSKPNILDTINLDKALRLAKKKAKNGQLEEAKNIYEDILQKFSKNKKARIALQLLAESATVAPQDPPSEQLQSIINLYNQGQLQQALSESSQMLERFPNSIVLYNIVGASNAGLMQFDDAIDSYKQALKIKPDYAEAYNNMGVVLMDKGEPMAAIDSYKKALQFKPNYAEAYYNMGAALQDKGDPVAAIDSYKKAIKFKPSYAVAYNNMGVALKEKGDPAAAIDSYKKALKIKPEYAEAYYNIGAALKEKGDPAAAIDSYKKALKIKPDYAEAYNNMGNALKDEGELEAAIDSFKQALKIKPDYTEAYNDMGTALQEKGDPGAAIDSYKKALKIKPDYAEAYYNIGFALKDEGELEAAIDSYEQALKIRPDFAVARGEKLHQQSHICDWIALEQDRDVIAILGASTEFVPPFGLLSLEDAPERHRMRSKTFAKQLYRYKVPLPPTVRPILKPQRLRIGYFSADFQEHPVAHLMAKVLETHDRERFEVYGYSIGPVKEDGMRQRLTRAFDIFHDVHDLKDQDVALLVRQDKIDIAIDLTGHTKNSRLGIFAYRAAPIHINYLGYPGTLGADFIDYIIADPVLIPSGYERYYDERILRLPNTYMPTDNTRPISTRSMTRSEMGLPDAGFVFCCFNNNYKISPREFDIWMRVLLKTEGSVLWMRNSNAWSEKNLRTQAQARGVAPSRLVFAGRAPMDEHLARHKLADLFLDTFAFNAHTTASEALWAGLLVVTKIGKGFAARVAASLLTAVGLPELITETEQEYETLILHLAANPERLAQIRQKLSDNQLSTPLFDTELYTKHLEDGYQQAYQRYFDGKPPEEIFVSEIAPQDPPSEQLQPIIILYNQGQLQQALSESSQMLERFPNSIVLYNIVGASNAGLMQFDDAIDSYKQALKIKPDYAEAYNNMGVVLMDKGEPMAAIDSYKKALQFKPNYAEAYYNMGAALQDKGDPVAAIDSYKKAIKFKPSYAVAYNNMGVALKEKGDPAAAIDSYKQALKIKPDYAEAYNNMGVALKEKGNPAAAIDSYKQALKIKPDYAEAYINMGNALKDKGELEAAIDSFKQALKIKPVYVEAYNNMGTALQEKGDPGAAIDSYKQALKIKPDYAEAYNNMGAALQGKGYPDAAIDSYKKALKIKPDYAGAYNNMGNALQEKGDPGAAIDSFKQALKIKPDYAEVYNNMGAALQGKGDPDAAIDSYKQALKIKLDYAEAYNNMGIALKDKGELVAAIDSLKQALKIKPDYAEAHHNKSLAHLLLQDFDAGWPLYEWRLFKKDAPAVSPRKNLAWDGKQSLKGKRFLIYEEQGLGDIIQFCRYLPFLQEDAQVTFKLTPKLHALIATMNCDISFSAILPNESDIDFEAPLMSLPLLMGTSVDTIPPQSPYLFADDAKIQAWQKNLLSDKFKIGICWQGSKAKIDRGRSFPLNLFKGISSVSGVELISLHKGDGEEQLTEIAFDVKKFGIEFDGGQDAFLDTAAVIMNCDLVITSDTAVAHLAGALGRQTWVVLQHIPDWRWMLNRSDSPWYPSMTLYRQNTRGDWLKVFRTMEQDLRSLINLKGI